MAQTQSLHAGEAVMFLAWGKLSQAGAMHPLEAHMFDVAACFLAIAEIGGIKRALELTAGRILTKQDLERLGALAFLHDVGKANAGFQSKRWTAASGSAPPGWPNPAGHGDEALQLFSEEHNDLLQSLPLEQMHRWGRACFGLLCASISHHGRPVVADASKTNRAIWRAVMNAGRAEYDPAVTLRHIGKLVVESFPAAFQPGGEEIPSSPQFAHLFAGLVQLADWLGSDTAFFPYSEPGEDRSTTAPSMAQKAVAHIGLDADLCRAALAEIPDFSSVFGVPSPRPIQAAMADPSLGSLLILESETGSGKTEAALWRFAQLFRAGRVDSLYFALPTRVAATQLYDRTRQFATNLWANSGVDAPMVVRALTGYECVDGHEIKARLPDFEVLWADKPDEQSAHKRWAAESSKRFLAAPLAVGTIDQALLGALQVRHAHLRHGLLARSLLVVDEVHASDAYMSTLLAHLLKAHLNAGGHALLLSATLGSSARHKYQRLLSPNLAQPEFGQACAVPYPALTDGMDTRALPDAGRSKHVHWHVKDWMDDPEAVATLVIDAVRCGARVLVIRNTVPAALATFRAIERQAEEAGLAHALFQLEGVRTVHHSRYSREDRPRLDQSVERQIGRLRLNPLQPCIVVGTQTLEQSLDIDADLLVTDLCPMDVLLQRVGRLHRHLRALQERPESYRTAQAVVLVPQGGSLASCLKKSRHGLGRFHDGGGVYIDLRVLEATRRLITLTNSHEIPKDNRELVERATHPQMLQAIANELGAEWVEHGQAVDGEIYAGRVQANFNVLPFDKHFVTVDEQGYELDVLRFPDADQRITSRLGAADYLVTFDPPLLGPFGNEVRLLPIRHHLWPTGTSPDAQPSNIALLPEGGFSFTLGEKIFCYGRLGLE